MKLVHPGESHAFWHDTKAVPSFSKLTTDLSADVCVVGGGIAGVTTAYLLMKEGLAVCLLEDFELASGQTGRTTAHFVTALDDRYFEIEKLHGEAGARLAAASHAAAIERVERIVREEGIDCELERLDGYLFADGDSRTDVLKREMDAAFRAGLSRVEMLGRAPLGSFDTGPCIRFPGQLQLHPLKYLGALARRIVEGGGRIFTRSHVNQVQGGEDASVTTREGYSVRCKSIVVATNTPINDLFAIHTKQAPYRTYVVGFKVPKGSIEPGLYWDTLDPYHYIRLATGELDADVLIVGGEDHKTGQEEHPEMLYALLEDWTRLRFPVKGPAAYRWSGQVMEPVDGLAYLGHNPMDHDGVYVITGDSGNGMTHCTVGAMLITDQIMNRDNPWAELYSPSRISLRATPEFIRENANVAAQYADWFSLKRSPDLDRLQAGEGVVFRDGLRLVAAYKNRNGKVELMSAACPHLGGAVRWNPAEKSWDCPCHGSRFDCHGKVIEGPAFTRLKKVG